MIPAQYKLYVKIATPLLGVACLFLNPTLIYATDTTIGEYLYTDSYSPDVSGICKLNIKNPDGSSHTTNQTLTPTSDAWYGYTFTSPTIVGYYRSEICCDVGSDHMCIDKSFKIEQESSSSTPSASDIASAVWGYSNKTLTGFNNIVADVWSYATRSITGSVENTSATDITEIKKISNESRLMIEKLVNKPIIENSFEDFENFDLIGKIKDGQNISGKLYTNILLTQNAIGTVLKNWNNLKNNEIVYDITEIKKLLGEESDSSGTDTLFGQTNFIRDTFGYKEADLIYEDLQAVKDSLNFTQTTLAVSVSKPISLQKEFSSGSAYLRSSEKSLILINKRLKESEDLSSLIDSNLIETKRVLGKWSELSNEEKNMLVDKLSSSTLSFNRVPKVSSVLSNVYDNIVGDKKVKNKLLSIRAILFSNKKMLATGAKEIMLTNWLEEGSLVIKTLITNPSTLISQDVPLKYYLPKELKKEDIIESDAGITVKYDTDQDQLYVEGNFTLKPAETKTLKVRVEDVWVISDGQINTLKAQSDSLIKPLEKTSYYAQGITLKSDIDISLQKVRDIVNVSSTPESKIKSYREAQLELVAINERLEKLKDMVSLAQSSGSILGFVGGSQAIAVWGIALVVISAFVFMTIYMRKLVGNEKHLMKSTKSLNKNINIGITKFDKLSIFLVVAVTSALISSIAVKKIVIPEVSAKSKGVVLGVNNIDYKALKAVKLFSPQGVVKLYQDEATDIVLEIADNGEMAIEVERGEWRSRLLYNAQEVWVSNENIQMR